MENDLSKRISTAAFACRGYNVTNMGRTLELLNHSVFGKTVESFLKAGAEICADTIHETVDLVDRVRQQSESDMESYSADIAMIVSVEMAQLTILEQHFGVAVDQARMAFGYSLGEVTAVVAAGIYNMETALMPPLVLSKDVAELASDVSMGILFSRGPALDLAGIKHLCLEISSRGQGTLAISSYLSPNTVLLLGQQDTVKIFKKEMSARLEEKPHLRINPHHWPPMHTPITWQRNISTRAGVLLETAPGGFSQPRIPILSFVTGDTSYTDTNSREILMNWVDHPQQVWDVVERTLADGIETVIHVGPEPNILPATYERLSNNVSSQLAAKSFSGMGLRAFSRFARSRPWLTKLLPSDAALLRAPFVNHIILEEWLLEQEIQ